MPKKLPKSLKKFIRQEKARIRREFLDQQKVKEEIKKLMNIIETKKSKLMTTLMYATGMRVSEIINLKIDDLDFEDEIGHIRQAKGKKDRIFNIPQSLFSKLKKQVEVQEEKEQKYLFTGPKGRLSSRNLQ